MNKAFKKYAKMRYEQTPYELRAWYNSVKFKGQNPVIIFPRDYEDIDFINRRVLIPEHNRIIANAGAQAKKAAKALIRFGKFARKLKFSNKN